MQSNVPDLLLSRFTSQTWFRPGPTAAQKSQLLFLWFPAFSILSLTPLGLFSYFLCFLLCLYIPLRERSSESSDKILFSFVYSVHSEPPWKIPLGNSAHPFYFSPVSMVVSQKEYHTNHPTGLDCHDSGVNYSMSSDQAFFYYSDELHVHHCSSDHF